MRGRARRKRSFTVSFGIIMEDVPLAVELRDGGPVSELSQAGVAATSGVAVVMVV
jgi:hypothetical protein